MRPRNFDVHFIYRKSLIHCYLQASELAACHLLPCAVILPFRHAANGLQATVYYVGRTCFSNLLLICKYLQLLMKLINSVLTTDLDSSTQE